MCASRAAGGRLRRNWGERRDLRTVASWTARGFRNAFDLRRPPAGTIYLGGGGGQGLALIFIPTGGGGPLPPGPPGPLPWTPSPPPPSAQVQLKTWVLGTFFGDGEKISRRLRRMPHTVYLSFYVYSAFLVLQITMTQRSLSVYFCSPVQPSPRAKRKDVIDALLYIRFKDRITGRKR